MGTNGLFLLYSLSFIPVGGQYSEAIDRAREAAFMQCGIKDEWETTRVGAEKKVPKRLKQVAVVFTVVRQKEIKFNSRQFGSWDIHYPPSSGVRAVLSIPF
jgi:hypothetical protein